VTILPVPSKDPRDLLFNAQKIDEAVTGGNRSYVDRFGVERLTLAGAIDSIKTVTMRGAWATATAYATKDVVTSGGVAYIAVQSHVSGATFVGDAAYWRVYQGVTSAELASTSFSLGAYLVGYALNKTGAGSQNAKQKLDNIPLIEDMVHAGDSDISVAWARAAAIGGTWQMSGATFTLNPLNTLSVTTGFRVFGNGTTINHASNSVNTFSAVNVNDWMLKDFFIAGPGKANNAAKGVYREGGNRFLVENVVCANMAGHGFYEYPGIHQAPRGDQGNWVNCRVYNCWTGREDLPAQSNEYNNWINFTASGCEYPNITAAGNNQFVGGNIVDNTYGVWLKNGENHAHGMFVGVNINHNGAGSGGWNIRCTDVDNGETFTGCHVYGDNSGTGVIWLERSKGILFNGGILDASVYSEDATGYSFFTNNFCPDSVNTVGKYGAASKKIILRDNYTRAGMWKQNDPGSAFVRAARSGATLSIPANTATTLVFNTEAYDTRDMFNNTTGVATLPWLGNFKIYGSVFITAASGMTSGFMTLLVNGVAAAFAPVVAVNATQAFASFSWSIGGAAGATIELKILMPTGVTMALDSSSQLNIEEIT
jgi:hypothetical protein